MLSVAQFEVALPGRGSITSTSSVLSQVARFAAVPDTALVLCTTRAAPGRLLGVRFRSPRHVGGGGGRGAAGDLWEAGHPEVGAGRAGGELVELGEFLAGAVEADLQAVDFAEPAFASGFGDAGVQVVADLDQPLALCGVGAHQRAAQAGFSELNDQGA